ncbi:TonB-dependent receptor-like protein [Edaphobacter modestus]|uniref:TonB-dependent receptor-like protein n=1 Tax=Edaphobacter modestus TaxID=388466 RepID=A0A4Q7YX39_9BACT|nr:TonB-dependent receptor-like protein [Edaphobacter modestus]
MLNTYSPKPSAMLPPEIPSIVNTSTSAETEARPKDGVGVVKTEIKVVATQSESSEGFERRITPKEIETSAGTFGDPSRFMQMLPGIVSDNDKFNDFIVRGGNSQETLFIVDNIEMPSINQLALSNTTGGFVSMIDNKAIQQMTLHTDTYDSKYDQRLSAVVEISTTKDERTVPHAEVELGMAGVGGSIGRPWGTDGSMFLSGRQSILHLLTNDIGMNGVPIYNNSLFRADKRIDDRNKLWGLSVTGVDSISIHPNPMNRWQTNPYDIAYKGWRNTTGLNWQHVFSKGSFGVLSLANSEQSQSLRENAQLLADATVYAEDTRDGITRAKFDGTIQAKSWLTITAGVRTAVNRTNYRVDQPLGLQNPYSESAAPVNAMSLNRNFSTFSSAEYSQAAFLLPRGMKVVVGQRLSQWAILGSKAWTPKALLMMPIFGRVAHIGYAEYAQLPPSLYILAFNNQASLQPIRSRHITGGFEIVNFQRTRISVEAYQKRYSDYPVAVNFPQLSLANITNTFGQAFLMFPMTSKGLGLARGVELGLDYRLSSRLTLTSAVTYSRNWYSGLDGVLRRGSFDLPFVANIAGNIRLRGNMIMSSRYSVASGKPYTPDNLLLSTMQNRDVYDLSKINASRAAAYSRLDFRLEQSHSLRRGTFTWHVGLQNALGTSNFYSYEWRPRANGAGVLAQEQMPRFPDGGFKYAF